jgi:hypothetical protein
MTKPMSLTELRAKTLDKPLHVDIDVPDLGTIRLKRLKADACMALGRQFTQAKADAQGELQPQDLLDFYVLLLANSIVDEDDTPGLLSPEGKQIIARFPIQVLTQLGGAALELNEFRGGAAAVAAREKNSPLVPIGSSPSSSVET